jgi:hypothetical protein
MPKGIGYGESKKPRHSKGKRVMPDRAERAQPRGKGGKRGR